MANRKKRNISGKLKLSATQIIAVAFAAIILLGAVLLMLPVSGKSGESCGFLPALFTATSATCVTGLTVFDTGSYWSSFGKGVILCLIEVGGLGFMSVASVVLFLFKRKIGLRQRMVMAQAMSLNEMEDVVTLQKWVILGSLAIQAVGMVILTLRFLPAVGFTQALKWGVFHAVSAFCNAGFDIFGTGQSIVHLNGEPVVCITLMALVVIGGLGFFVWEEIATKRHFKKFSVYTKLVLITSGVLIVVGAGLFLLLEWQNPATIGNMPLWQKVLNAFFQSVTLRTAGFASVDQGMLTEGSKAMSIVWMLIGGSSGSTAGGLKTVTFVVILLFIWTRARGRNTISVFKRTIPSEKVLDAMTIVSIMITLCFAGAVFIAATSPVGFVDSLYETASALGTVGLTANVTGKLSIVAKMLIILFMYFGRVGVLTISLGFLMGNKAKDRFRYADTNLLIG